MMANAAMDLPERKSLSMRTAYLKALPQLASVCKIKLDKYKLNYVEPIVRGGK